MSPQYLIKGELSNIQQFIFNVKSDGAARSIRGRSFFLKVIIELAMESIFKRLKIDNIDEKKTAKISTSGGNFILSVQSNPEQIINEIGTDFLMALQFTDLKMFFAFEECQSSNFAEAMKNLDSKLRTKRYKQYENSFSNSFEPFDHYQIRVNKNDNWYNLATTVINENCDSWDIESDDTSNDLTLRVSSKTISMAGYTVKFKKNGVFELNRFIESLTPKTDRGEFKMFENFVDEDRNYRGIRKLGILAMDIDKLGQYIEGIKNEKSLTELDKKLFDFYNKEVLAIIQKDFNQKIYPITAGGDDSYFVGLWSILLEFAIKIEVRFSDYFKDEKFKISAALIIVKPTFPVVRFIELIDTEIKKAKYQYPESRGNISLFGEILQWDCLEKQIQPLRDKFKNSLNFDGFSKGLLAKARLTAKDIADENQGMKLADYWKMDYYLRNKKNSSSLVGLRKEFRKNLDESLNVRVKNPELIEDEILIKIKNYRLIFPIAARLAELDKRK